jgi:putative ABC transport system permease protein
MRLAVILRLSVAGLTRHPLRSTLTILGMIIGVAAVITIAAIGAGAKQAIEDSITSAGTNMIVVRAGNRTIGGVRLGMGSSSRLSFADGTALRALPGVAYVSSGLRSRQQMVSQGVNWSTSVEGCGAEMPLIRNWRLIAGTFFTNDDVRNAEPVAVLGSLVRDVMFGPGENPVGRTLRVGIVPFRIIGVLASKGQSAAGADEDDTIFVPFTTVQKRLMGVTYLDRITLSARSADRLDDVVAAATRILRVRHQIAPGAPDDFRIRNLEEIAGVRSRATETLRWLLVGIAAIALVVGGVGIMNIMLVAVTDRTREIGIRAAIGARQRDVLLQFLVEAALMSIGGGLFGIVAGIFSARALTAWLSWPTDVTSDAVLTAFLSAVMIGIICGIYPARKAARLDPIDALRFE